MISKAVSGQIDLPEIQRSYVWTKHQVQELLDSILKRYPLGSILIWDISSYTQGKFINESTPKEWIVDGQQRITTFCLIARKKPYWFSIDEWQELIDKYRVKINVLTLEVALESSAIRYDPRWIYPHEVFNAENLSNLAESYANKLNDPKLFTRIYDNLNTIKDSLNIELPIIKISTSLENIATIFERINSGGTRVKQADVTLAYVAAYNPSWVREKLIKYLDDLEDEGFGLDPTLLVRALAVIGEDKAILKDVSDKFLRNENHALDSALEQLKSSLYLTIEDFRKIGILTSDIMYAKNAIIPILYLRNKFKNEFEFKKALYFFLMALWAGRYSGSAETTLQEDINKVKRASDFNSAIEALLAELKNDPITVDKIKNTIHYQGEGRFLKLLLYLVIFKKGAADWFTKVRIGFTKQNEVNKNFNIEEHHIFPKSLLRSLEMQDKADLLPNIAFINPGTNKKLRDQPLTYIRKYNIDRDELEKQLLPLDEELLKVQNYDRFLEKRSELITYEINKYLSDLYPGYPD
ncbi:MAG: DUF262 domain-containing protein [Candidatus Bathyarchaeia archaeon]